LFGVALDAEDADEEPVGVAVEEAEGEEEGGRQDSQD